MRNLIEPNNQPATNLSPTPGHILVVDDSQPILEIVQRMLRWTGYRTGTAASAEEALRLIGQTRPDLILLDINLGEVSGYEVCQTLKNTAQTRHIPVVFISISNQRLDEAAARMTGGADFLLKPFRLQELTCCLEQHLHSAPRLNEIHQN